MTGKVIHLWKKEEYQYPCAGEFLPNIMAYVHDDKVKRPAMLVVPGGGYAMVSPSEGECVAEKFYEAGYQAFVLTYTTNMFQVAPLGRQPLKDISRAVCYIRRCADELYVRDGQIACCGFSAGAHLVGSLAVHYQEPELAKETCRDISNRPDAILLCYPVITSGECAHKESFKMLLGNDASEKQLEWASLEKHVTADTPPAFLWQTLTDELVPVENSILYAKACREAGVSCELHLFMEGCHGMSLADEDWASGNIGKDSRYTMMQQWQTMKIIYKQNPRMLPEVFVPLAETGTLMDFAEKWNDMVAAYGQQERHADKSVMQWSALALAWLENVFHSYRS